MANFLTVLRQVFSRQGSGPEMVVKVISHEAGGRSQVELDGGARVLVDGQNVGVGEWARVRDRVIVGSAESCTHYEIEV